MYLPRRCAGHEKSNLPPTSAKEHGKTAVIGTANPASGKHLPSMSTATPSPKHGGKNESTLEEWSSFIGIITAICGNILISFALNIQRYAHLRLERERRQGNQTKPKSKENTRQRTHGTQQNEIAEERARLNLEDPYSDRANSGRRSDGQDAEASQNETDGDKRGHAISLHSRRSADSLGEDAEKQSEEQGKKSYLRSPFWWLGLVLMTTGEAGNFLAYGFAPASTVSPLGVVALISNCIIAPCLLKERFRQRDFWGVLIAIAGAVIIVYSAKNSETKMGPDDVWHAITRWEFETYLGITIGFIIVLMWASGRYGERTILIDIGLVALFGGYTALSTKGVASLLSDTLWRVLTFPVTYLLVAVLVLSALAQIRYINRALQRFDSTQVIPTQFVLFTISVIVGSAVLYRDFKSATGAKVGAFIGGCLLTFLGVYLITSGRHGRTDFDRKAIATESDGPIRLVDEEEYHDEVSHEEERHVVSKDTAKNDEHSRRPSRLSDASGTSRISDDSEAAEIVPSTPPILNPPNLDRDIAANPWRSADNVSQVRPLPLESSVSSPVLPLHARHASLAPLADAVGEHSVDDNLLQPITTLPETPTQVSRVSLSRRLTPGLYMSPLSSPLSALVADSNRRGLESPSSRYRRPRLSGLKKSRSTRDTLTAGELSTDASTPLTGGAEVGEGAEASESTTRPEKRSRSLSKTIGDLFRLKRDGKPKSHDEHIASEAS